MKEKLELFDYVKYTGDDPIWKQIKEGVIMHIEECPLGLPYLVVHGKDIADRLVEKAEERGLDLFQELEGADNNLEAQKLLMELGLKHEECDYFSGQNLEAVYFEPFDALEIMLSELRRLFEEDEDMSVENEEVAYIESSVVKENGITLHVGDLVEDGWGFQGVIVFIEQENEDTYPVQVVSVEAIKEEGYSLRDFILKVYESVNADMSEEEAGTVASMAVRESGVGYEDYDYYNPEGLFYAGGNVLTDNVEEYFEEAKKPVVYLACPLSTEGDVMFANTVAQLMREKGLNVYSPIEDESINDKSNDPEPEDIFVNDYIGIEQADYVFLVETGREQVGTHVELGIVLEKIVKGKTNRVYAKRNFSQFEDEEPSFIQGERYEYIDDGNFYYLITEQGDIESLHEKDFNQNFEHDKVPDLFVYVNNKRLQEPQIKYGKPSASMNQLALGGIMEYGTMIDADNLEDAVEEFAEYVSLLETKVSDL